MNNSVFGKTGKYSQKSNVRLVTSKEKLLKLASKPTYVSSKIFNEIWSLYIKAKKLTLNRPAYVLHAGIPITEFVGLRSKMYSCVKDNKQTARTAKGIKKQVIRKNIKHDHYKDVLFNNKQIMHTMKTIRSEKHQLGSFKLNKISLSCFDDKKIHT